jgi:hypothetical protein
MGERGRTVLALTLDHAWTACGDVMLGRLSSGHFRSADLALVLHSRGN